MPAAPLVAFLQVIGRGAQAFVRCGAALSQQEKSKPADVQRNE
jgi:hypothetical protein